MTGRSRSRRRNTVGWEQLNKPAASSWVMFVRINVTTMATGRDSPAAAGRPPGRTAPPIAVAARAATSVSCPRVSPVRACYRNGFSLRIRMCDGTNPSGEAVRIRGAARRRQLRPLEPRHCRI